MKKIFALIFLGAMGASLNVPLMLRNEAVLLSSKSSEDGWKTHCLYYKPFEVRTVEIPHYQRCERVRQEDTARRPGSFFWEHRA